jgi:hypothetical protein
MINKEKFQAFEKVRVSGETNMANHAQVVILAGGILNIEDVKLMIASYGDYQEEYNK